MFTFWPFSRLPAALPPSASAAVPAATLPATGKTKCQMIPQRRNLNVLCPILCLTSFILLSSFILFFQFFPIVLQWGAPQQTGYQQFGQQQVGIVAAALRFSFCIALSIIFLIIFCLGLFLLLAQSFYFCPIHQWGSGGWPPPSQAPQQQQGVFYGAMHQQVVVDEG